jgi:hypothetical protein
MHHPSKRTWDEDRIIRILRDGPLDDDEVDFASRIYRAIRDPWLRDVCKSQGFREEVLINATTGEGHG